MRFNRFVSKVFSVMEGKILWNQNILPCCSCYLSVLRHPCSHRRPMTMFRLIIGHMMRFRMIPRKIPCSVKFIATSDLILWNRMEANPDLTTNHLTTKGRAPVFKMNRNASCFLKNSIYMRYSSFFPSLFSEIWRFIAAHESAVKASHRTNRSMITFLSLISDFLFRSDISVIPFLRKRCT